MLAGPARFDIFAIVIGALDKQKYRSQKQENWPKIPVATSKVNPEQPSAPILGCLLVAACGRPNREMQMMSHFVKENLRNLLVTKILEADQSPRGAGQYVIGDQLNPRGLPTPFLMVKATASITIVSRP